MKKYVGKVAFKGYAIGQLIEFNSTNNIVKEVGLDSNIEIKRFLDASKTAVEQLEKLYEDSKLNIGDECAQIFLMHKMLIEDPDLKSSVIEIIENQKVCAQYATKVACEKFYETFSLMKDDYMSGRSADFNDISKRITNILLGVENQMKHLPNNTILVSDDLTPSETVLLDKTKVIAFITRVGSINSHTAILSRMMNIPSLVCVDIPKNINGKQAVVDGFESIVLVDPCEQLVFEYTKKRDLEDQNRQKLELLKTLETKTKSGKQIKLCANINGINDIDLVLDNNADGIGLFRSEFLYLQSTTYPTEEQQLCIYKEVVAKMGGKEVIIRTLDIGADKHLDYFDLPKEENPALGLRGIRICLSKEEIFKTQLRAIYRTSEFGRVSIMIPMITSEWEIIKCKDIIEEVKKELITEGYKPNDVDFGIMIETPAAVILADKFAKLVDFFSIGTNDLTQYTLALDRQNPHLDMFYDAHHEAVLNMIEMVAKAANDNGIWAGICGELAADSKLTSKFIKMGIKELSVSSSMLLSIKEEILNVE